MKHLKRFNESNDDKPISYYDKLRQSGDLSDIMHIIENSDIIDEFPDLDIDYFNSSNSTCLEHALQYDYLTQDQVDYLIKNSFTVEIYQKNVDYLEREAIHYIEPKIWGIIEEINFRLDNIGFKIAYNDFGSGDTSYELIITDKSY